MKLSEIETPISSLSGVGPAKAKLFANLGIFTVADLLSYYPKDWEDRTRRVTLSEYACTSKVHTVAQVIGHTWFGFGSMRTLKITITDGTASGELVAFNRPFLEKSLPVGSIVAITGHFSIKYGHLQSTSFEVELLGKEDSLENYKGTIVPGSAVLPIYSLTAGITNAYIRKVMAKALKEYGRGIENEIPLDLIVKRQLLHKQEAIWGIHCPKTLQQALDAKRTLIYEELFHFQLAIGARALEHKGRLPDIDFTESQEQFAPEEIQNSYITSLTERQKALLERLPYELTEDQKKCILQINIDLSKTEKTVALAAEKTSLFNMARLIQGDVGSGKTLVAFFACLWIVDHGGQCAIMAPTELLSRQHAENAAKQLESIGVRLAFLTGNIKNSGRGPLLKALKEGEVDILIGTHALFSRNVQYKNLKLVIVDEQHRFGVLQRNAILEKGRRPCPTNPNLYMVPSLLMLSATPIPRTLALTVFGDLDISIIKTMPNGRLPIKTYLTRMGNEANVYEFVRKEIKSGHQAYFVYPRIEEGEFFEEKDGLEIQSPTGQGVHGSKLKSAEEMFIFLSQQVYSDFRLALIHSRTEEQDQVQILEDFRTGKIQILVATTVVEVGVDVPNATCMVIEHAERFGLSALHQLRGRVGRGTAQSHCFLIYGNNLTSLGKERMKVLRETSDGFVIAEQDLKLRGPGEVTGIQQSGYLTLGIADPLRDSQLLELARIDAFIQLSKAD